MSAFLSKEEQNRIVKAIEEAELNTSGEVRVHLESKCKRDAVQRAVFVFNFLKMYKTRERNGVLIYLAYKSRKFAIIGDTGINEKVPDGFWDRIREHMAEAFSKGAFADGICNAIRESGESLKAYFPYRSDDINEQPNEISFGD